MKPCGESAAELLGGDGSGGIPRQGEGFKGQRRSRYRRWRTHEEKDFNEPKSVSLHQNREGCR